MHKRNKIKENDKQMSYKEEHFVEGHGGKHTC